MRLSGASLLPLLILTWAPALAGSFTPFDDPEGVDAAWSSFAFDEDGDRLACNFGGHIFLWDPSDGFRDLGRGHDSSGSVAISADGKVICASRINPADGYQNPALWSEDSGWLDLGFAPEGCLKNNSWGSGFGLSRDGSTAVGLAWSCLGGRAFRWDEGQGLRILEPRGEGPMARASSISADGSLAIGFLHHPERGFRRPALWDTDGNVTLYGGPDLAGEALAVSSDGTRVAGYHRENGVEKAHIWSPDEGIRFLGTLTRKPWDSSRATHLTDYGVVFGHGTVADWGLEVAFVWDPFDGMVSLREHLLAQGVPLPRHIWLDRVLAVSGDGDAILGRWSDGRGNEGHWLARNTPPLKGRIRHCSAQLEDSSFHLRFEMSRAETPSAVVLVAEQQGRQWTVPLLQDGFICRGVDHQAGLLEDGEVTYRLLQVLPEGERLLEEVTLWTRRLETENRNLLGSLFTRPREEPEHLVRVGDEPYRSLGPDGSDHRLSLTWP